MNEKDAIKKFYECDENNDLQGCLERLKNISIDTINKQDEDDYDMLIEAVVSEYECAVIALLQDNRCDRTHEENLCGMTAEQFAMCYPEDSPIRQAFINAPMQKFIYRNGKTTDRGDIFDRIMDGTLECDKGCFDMLPGDFYRAELVVKGKVCKEDFESWLNPAELHWDAQISLLIGNEEYGKKFVDWDYIRDNADANDWLSFLRDLPQYSDKADWENLIKNGCKSSWEALINARPEFKDKYQEWETYLKTMLRKYTGAASSFYTPFNLVIACERNDIEVVKCHLNNTSVDLNKNFIYPFPPGFPIQLPLAAAVKAEAIECIKLLLEHGADPDKCCNHKHNYKTPRELAADNPKILELFKNYKNEEEKQL